MKHEMHMISCFLLFAFCHRPKYNYEEEWWLTGEGVHRQQHNSGGWWYQR